MEVGRLTRRGGERLWGGSGDESGHVLVDEAEGLTRRKCG